MNTNERSERRKTRVRKSLVVSNDRPRIVVFRSNKYIYASLVDINGKTILSISDRDFRNKNKTTGVKSARELGKILAQKVIKLKMKSVVYDRGKYKYHGRVKELADGAREGGLSF